ncbi:hypothetical protein FEE95_21860 [Maribacter algarum]|uniref:Uncharacterized protein n=1 Tax=Maribacter algarum (ex Zhang et al. 2020) TaxID=2578118 RepID=A0A5S3PHU5_9FLAO|nr:hypothetical protein [Maribacter algarum]TMM51447.1 hypothetical protein FEE95_21860 [Maribacter algarum]
MKIKTIINLVFSIIVGLYLALHSTFISGMNPHLEKLLSAGIFLICILIIVSIYTEPNKKLQIIQVIILISAMAIGLYLHAKASDSINGENPRIYYQTDKN